jgi:hypothetical protein
LNNPPVQLRLSESQRNNGLEPGGVAIPGTPVAIIDLSTEELQSRRTLQFERTFDDLDYLDAALLELPEGQRFALTRHANAPDGGTTISVFEADSFDSQLLQQILRSLDIEKTQLRWTAPQFAHPDSGSRRSGLLQAWTRRINQLVHSSREREFSRLVESWIEAQGWKTWTELDQSDYQYLVRSQNRRIFISLQSSFTPASEAAISRIVEQAKQLRADEDLQGTHYVFVFWGWVDRDQLPDMLSSASPMADFYSVMHGRIVPLLDPADLDGVVT